MLLSLMYLVIRMLLRLLVQMARARPPRISRSSCYVTN
jgi:hypothetical protein